MDVDESMLENTGLDDRVDPEIFGALPFFFAVLEPFEKRIDLLFDDGPCGRLMMNDRLSIHDVADTNLFATKLARASMASSNAAYERLVEVQQIAPGQALITHSMKRLDRLKGLQVVAELALAVPEVTGRKFFREFEGLFEREGIALDLDTGQRLADFGFASNLTDPFGLEADGGEEAAGALYGLQLAEDSGGEVVRGTKHPGRNRQNQGFNLVESSKFVV